MPTLWQSGLLQSTLPALRFALLVAAPCSVRFSSVKDAHKRDIPAEMLASCWARSSSVRDAHKRDIPAEMLAPCWARSSSVRDAQ